MNKNIETREDINVLVNKFYAKIRKDDVLGEIFNAHIAKDKWPEHLEKLTDFWEMILFGKKNFFGSPTYKHVNVDRNMNHTISQEHFGRWLLLWFETIDELYTCDIALKAKESARKMAHGQFMAIWNRRT